MTNINNSAELLSMIKDVAKSSSNWKKCGEELAIRLAFGVMNEHDIKLTTPSGFNLDSDDEEEILFSQMKKDDAREKFISSKASVGVKQDALNIDTYLSRLYNEEENPFYHGFLHEMQINIKDSILFLNGKFDLDTFPPSAETTKMIEAFANENSNDSLNGLVAKREYFPPYNKNSRNPPEKNQWKRLPEGKEYFKRKGDTAGTTSVALGTTAVQSSTIAIPTARVGIAVVDTGVRTSRFKYTDDETTASEDDSFISTSKKLKDLVQKAKCWPKYDREFDERHFEVKNSSGEVFTTLDKKDLSTFTIHDIVMMMNIKSGEFHIVGRTRSKKIESVDVEDEISM